MTLATAAAALERDDIASAAAALLAVWRKVKDARVAGLLDELSRRIARPALAGTHKHITAEVARLIAGGDPLDQPRIAAAISAARSPQMIEQLETLLEHGAPDPRYTIAFVALLNKPPFIGSAAQSAWRRMFKVLQTWADPRVLELLPPLDFPSIVKAHHPHMGEGRNAAAFFRERCDAVCAAIAKRGMPRLPASDDALLARLATQLDRALETALVAEVHADPDAGAQAILADHLLEKGDKARGRFVILQQQRAQGRLDAVEEERALLAAHGVRWLGDLADIVEHATMQFEHGFLSWCVVDTTKPGVVAKAVGNPAWATVRGIHVEGDFAHELLAHDAMRSLVEVTGIRHRGGIGEVLDKPHIYPWTSVGVVNQGYDRGRLAQRLRAVFPQARALYLHAHGAPVTDFGFLWSDDYAELTTIGFTAVALAAIPDYLAALLAYARPSVTTLELSEFHHLGWRFRLAGEQKRFTALDLQARAAWGRRTAKLGDLVVALASLGRRFTTIRVHDRATKAERAAIETTLLAPGGELVLLAT